MYQNFDDEKKEKASRNPFNRHILKGGQVDPGSKLYQRSVAGREKLDAMLKRLWSDGMHEADVFMAGVKALTSRDKGYVGAYLDAKNPGRRYQENEAMAITDQVMKDSGIGSHPGNRLTREKDEEGKAKRKEENISRGGFGPKQAPGAKAMSVRQQRKQGKRPSTGQPVEETDREGIADRETGPRSEWQNTLKDALEGKITAADVVKAFSKEKQSPLSQSPQAQAKRDQKTKERQQKMRDQIAEQKGLRDQEAAAGPEPEEASLTAEQISEIENKDYGFRANINDFYNKREDKDDERLTPEIIDKAINQVATDLDVDPALVSDYVARKYPSLIERSGWTPQKSAATPEQPSAAPTETAAAPEPAEGAAAGTKEPPAAPESKAPTPAPEPAEGAAPETEEAPAPAPEAPKEEEEAPAPAPEPEAPAAGPSEEEAPTSREVTSKGGFKALLQQGRKKSGGKGFGGARAAVPEIMKAGKEAQSLEDFKTYLYNKQGNLLGGRGFETGGSDQEADPYAKYRGEPAEPELGAQAGGREPATAGRGEEGQGSLLKKGTTEARGDFKKGQKPKPQRKKRQRPTSENPPPPAKSPSTQNERASRFKELIDSGMSAQKALSIMKQEGSVNTRSAKRSRKRGVSNNAEYQEFAQSIRSMMR